MDGIFNVNWYCLKPAHMAKECSQCISFDCEKGSHYATQDSAARNEQCEMNIVVSFFGGRSMQRIVFC